MHQRYGKGRDNNSRGKIARKSFRRSRKIGNDRLDNYVHSDRYYGQQKRDDYGRTGKISYGYPEDYDEQQAGSDDFNVPYYNKENDQNYDTKKGRYEPMDKQRYLRMQRRNPTRSIYHSGKMNRNGDQSRPPGRPRTKRDNGTRRFDR